MPLQLMRVAGNTHGREEGTGTVRTAATSSPEGSVRDGTLFATAQSTGCVGLFASLRADNMEHAVQLAEMLGKQSQAERAARALAREQAALDKELGMLLQEVVGELDG